jgi:hypothetical protein
VDRNEANLIQKKIDAMRVTLKSPFLKVSDRRLLVRRLEGLKMEFEKAVREQMGVI